MTSARSAETSLAVVPSTGKLIEANAGTIAEICKEERNRKSLTICVAKSDVLKQVEKICSKRRAPPTLFTKPEYLQDTINSIKLSDRTRTLNILVSGDVSDISFHVPSHFNQLKVLRCVRKRAGGRLLVDGSSTYNGVRLDKWQANRHKNHVLVIGHEMGVRIKLNSIVNLPKWSRCRHDFSESERQELRSHFESLSDRSRWDEVKGKVASIMGLALGSVELGVGTKESPGGMCFKYAFGLHSLELGMSGATFACLATAAGSAVVLGVGVAVAVYFVPWQDLFDWLKGAFCWLWDRIAKLWQSFTDWVKRLYSGRVEEEDALVPVRRPMILTG